MFNRRELALLRAMYHEVTVTAAAASINMTQPAASALLRDMETRLGFALFQRENRRLRLSGQGRALMPEVLNALAGIEAVDRLANDIRHSAMSRVALGAVSIAASSVLPGALTLLRQRNPEITITLRSGTAPEIIEMALDHRIDLGVVVGSPREWDRIHSQVLGPLSLHAVMHARHAWAQRRRLSLSEVADSAPIVLGGSLPAGRATRQALEDRGLPFKPVAEAGQSSAACALAAEGLGVAIVETLGARYAQRQGLVTSRLVRVPGLALAQIWARDRTPGPAAAALQTLIAEQARSQLQDSE